MSVYEGTRIEQSYANGRDVGRGSAARDLYDQQPCVAIADDHRVEASAALYRAPLGDSMRAEAAFLLGFARGYRERLP